MKKLLLVFSLLVVAMLNYAQQTKRVAILEVVDREGKLGYSQKMVLRANMARAVANTDGYEAYDRSDVDAIMSEHDFQRTGLVSNDQIAQLGEMAGVSLILVTEGVLLEQKTLFVSSKIIDVKTGQVDMTENVTMGTDPNMMQQGCNELARRLFGIGAVSSQTSKDYIKALSSHYYSYRGQTLDEKAYMNFLRNNCPEAFTKYMKGRSMVIAGWAIFVASAALTGAGVGMAVYYGNKVNKEKGEYDKVYNAFLLASVYDDDFDVLFNELETCEMNIKDFKRQRDGGIAMSIIGPAVVLGASVPLWCCGIKAKKESMNIYNTQCASSRAKSLSLNLTAGSNGIGLALQF